MERKNKGKNNNWEKILCSIVIGGLVVGGLSLLIGYSIGYVGVIVVGTCCVVGASVVAVVRDIIKNISYEYVYEDDEYEEYIECEETNEKDCQLHLVKNDDTNLVHKFNYEYKGDNLVHDNTPKLEIVNPSNGYSRKRKK